MNNQHLPEPDPYDIIARTRISLVVKTIDAEKLKKHIEKFPQYFNIKLYTQGELSRIIVYTKGGPNVFKKRLIRSLIESLNDHTPQDYDPRTGLNFSLDLETDF